MCTVRARTPTKIFPERRGGVALERPTWRAIAEPEDRRPIAAMDVHEVNVCFAIRVRGTTWRCHVGY